MSDETTPPPVPKAPDRGARGGVPSAVPDGGDLQSFTRGFVSGARPIMMANAKMIGGGAALLLISIAQHYSGKADTKAVKDQVVETTKATDKALNNVVVPRSNEISDQLEALKARVTSIETTQKEQSTVIASGDRDFVVVGRPAKRRDPILAKAVKAVKANAAKDAKELEVRRAKPAPVLKPLPPIELLPAGTPPSGAAISAAPSQVRDAGNSP